MHRIPNLQNIKSLDELNLSLEQIWPLVKATGAHLNQHSPLIHREAPKILQPVAWMGPQSQHFLFEEPPEEYELASNLIEEPPEEYQPASFLPSYCDPQPNAVPNFGLSSPVTDDLSIVPATPVSPGMDIEPTCTEMPVDGSPGGLLAPPDTASFRFKKNGKKKLKSGVTRFHFKCSWFKKEGILCGAKKYEDRDKDGKLVYSSFIGTHNHGPQPPKLNHDVRSKAKSALAAGATPALIHTEMVLSTDVPSASNIPSLKQLSNMKYHLKSGRLPSNDAIKNVMLAADGFLLQFTLYPMVMLVFATKESLTLLQDSAYVFIDGTFDMAECDMQLTTLMVVVEGIGVPVAFMLSQSRTADCYAAFLRAVKENCKNQVLEPVAFFGDFELALQESVNRVFPTTNWYSDYFHFVQANLRWLQKNHASHLRDTLAPHLRALYESDSAEALGKNLPLFYAFWGVTYPSYKEYFGRNWGMKGIHPPFSWCSYARKNKQLPSGDQLLENWHKRLKHHSSSLLGKKDPIDHLALTLRNEWLFFEKTLASEHLLSQRKKEIEEGKLRYQKRVTLRDLIPNDNSALQTHSQLQLETTTHSSALLLALASPEGPSIDNNDETAEPPSKKVRTQSRVIDPTVMGLPSSRNASSAPTPMTQILQDPPQPSPGLFHLPGFCSCGKKKPNKTCSLKKCKACCIQSKEICSLPDHQQAKIQPLTQPFIDQINTAISKKSSIQVCYMGGSAPGTTRPLLPTKWVTDKITFEAVCQNSGISKKYNIAKIKSLKDA